MFSISIGTCPNCKKPTHKEVGSIGQNSTDACPSCRFLYTEDGQTNSALLNRVYKWKQIKSFYNVKTFLELSEKLKELSKEHYQEDNSAWVYDDFDYSELCKLGGLYHSVNYGLETLKNIESQIISRRLHLNNLDLNLKNKSKEEELKHDFNNPF